MADLTMSTAILTKLQPVLVAIETLTPPPTPKGRYVLGRASDKATVEKTSYDKRLKEFLDSIVTRNDDDQPIYTPAENGQITFTIPVAKQAEYAQWITDVGEEMVTLAGIRQITHAELGDCPITVAQERILISAGLLEDVEPA